MPMIPMLALLASSSWAGTALWLNAPPDPSRSAGLTAISIEQATPSAGWTEADSRAIGFLREELAGVRPLADVFDGELQIMLRLQTALSDVRVIRPEDRDLVYDALLFEGFAAHRYFQDKLATDPAAAPYRVTVGDAVEVAAWVNAVALNAERAPTALDLADPDALLAFQELRARHLLRPTATVTATGLPAGGRLVVDGREAAVERTRVPAGHHRVSLTVEGSIRARAVVTLEPGQEYTLVLPASGDDLRALAGTLQDVDTLDLDPGVLARLEGWEAPVALVVSSKKSLQRFEVQDGKAVRVVEPTEAGAGLLVRATLAGAWVTDGDYFLQNAEDGAPGSVATVNAFAPTAAVEVEWRTQGRLAGAAGVDLGLPLGDWHDLPVGEGRLRLRAYPHLAVGLPLAQLSVGLMLPWRVGLGARVHVPLGDHLELGGAYVYGIGVNRERDAGPTFEPTDAQTAWVGVGGRFGPGAR